ncbi:hypothetical protein [Acetohalobium arabaticum]|uniref:Uncharacterized protein n=1 Tax=Acetohalobium arabaticum (strain ATCC 49924 / DSM 5501 / Z-7288) TaxID=574087 RepID=D9QQI5_ACEAZ|nr:hypothetical protein [Acetohalobium arabaticum]ADL12776.1 conserved hypothetical protein [Acetohalobium arabaticum DSM 5501]
MSLTSFIKKADIRKNIDKTFNKPSFSQSNIEMKVKPPKAYSGKDYMLIGTAFDYLFRFYLKHEYKDNAKDSHWIAHTSLYLLSNKISNIDILFPQNFLKEMGIVIPDMEGFEEVPGVENHGGFIIYDNIEYDKIDFDKIVKYIMEGGELTCSSKIEKQFRRTFNAIFNAEKVYNKYVKDGKMNEEVIKAIIDLAKIDDYLRGRKFNETLGEYKKEYIEDLKNLYHAIPEQNNLANKVYLNPTFGKGSKLVNGADADLIINDTLIDVKTTKNLNLTAKQWRQLVGYLTLIDFQNKFSINKAGIYFSRYGYFYTFDACKIYNSDEYGKFKKWFIDKAKS